MSLFNADWCRWGLTSVAVQNAHAVCLLDCWDHSKEILGSSQGVDLFLSMDSPLVFHVIYLPLELECS